MSAYLDLQWTRWIGIVAVAMAASTAADVAATTSTPTVETHDFDRGPAIIRKTLQGAWNEEPHFLYQSFGCTSSSSIAKNDGEKDEKPIIIGKILLLGTRTQILYPVYLVSGTRTIWLEKSLPKAHYVALPCTWLVAFHGNKVGSVREASELSYLFGN